MHFKSQVLEFMNSCSGGIKKNKKSSKDLLILLAAKFAHALCITLEVICD